MTAAVLFSVAAGFLFYALVGYPLLLALLARWRARPIRKAFAPRSVTILLPVHNGERWIRAKLESIAALDYPKDLLHTVVISDGSTDATEAIAGEFAGVEIISLPKGGKAAALNRGLALARGELIFFTDTRQRLDRACVREMASCFSDATVGAVCGELIIADGETFEEASVGLYWKIEKWIRKQLSAIGTLLVVTGCLYMVRRSLAEPLPEGALGDDIFMPQAILRQGFRVIFEPAARAYDYATAHKAEFPRKVRTLAGIYQFVGHRGFGARPFHFFSYKVTRLLLPYMLLVTFVAVIFLPAPFDYYAVVPQILFYVLALCDRFLPERFPLKQLTSPIRTFCMLMAASLWAASILFVPPATLWKTTQVKSPKLLS